MKHFTPAEVIRIHIRDAILAECQGDGAPAALDHAVECILNLIEGRVLETILDWRDEDWRWHFEQFPELAARVQGQLPKAEPPPAQDKQSPEQMLSREQIENIARKVHGDCIRLPGATYQHAAEAAVMHTLERIARPAQTEQQPVGEMISNDGDIYWTDRHPPMGTKLYTAPIVQTEQLEPVAWAVYDIAHGGSCHLHWHEQHDPAGNSSAYRAVPLYAAPIAQTEQTEQTDRDAKRWQKCKTMPKSWWLEAMAEAGRKGGRSLDESIDAALSTQGAPNDPAA